MSSFSSDLNSFEKCLLKLEIGSIICTKQDQQEKSTSDRN